MSVDLTNSSPQMISTPSSIGGNSSGGATPKRRHQHLQQHPQVTPGIAVQTASGIIKPTQPIPPKSTTIKTDKPRPHVCTTCTRSFARLEHLKRHERSHTKEKPFKCDVCERCFARRDLLLRHRQKLHASFPESMRIRQKRRKTSTTASGATTTANGSSTNSSATPASGTPGQEHLHPQDNSGGNNGGGPLGNLAGIDLSTHPLFNAQAPQNMALMNPTLEQFKRSRTMSFSATSADSYSTHKDIAASHAHQWPSAPPQVGFSTPQLVPLGLHHNSDSDSNSVNMSLSESNFNSQSFDDFFQASDPLFINPQLLGQSTNQQLQKMHDMQVQYHQQYNHSDNNQRDPMNHDTNQHHNQQQQQQQQHQNHHHDDLFNDSDVFDLGGDFWPGDSSHHPQAQNPQTSNAPILQSSTATTAPKQEEVTHSPQSILSMFGGSSQQQQQQQQQQHPPVFSPISDITSTTGGSSVSPPHSEIFNNQTSIGFVPSSKDTGFVDFIPTPPPSSSFPPNQNFHLPQQQLQQQQHQQQQQQSQQPTSHIITPQLRLHVLTTLSSTQMKQTPNPTPHLPSTLELQRYINAYLDNFGKHIPFLHHTLEFTAENMPLALAMASIGALYTFEHANSASIFEISRCCIHAYLETRRDSQSQNHGEQSNGNNNHKDTPLWLVQALVLGVIYGLFSSDKVANEIAVAQAVAVVSLAKSAGLNKPPFGYISADDSNTVESKWQYFIRVQERIRTMHVVHTMSCLLVTSYDINLATLKNRDIECGSPCDESLWTAPSASAWWEVMRQKELDGSLREAVVGPDFQVAINTLLSGNTLVGKVPQFTLLSLMYAIHLEIHEQRRKASSSSDLSDTLDTSWETQIEGALRAWETTWSLSPLASLSPSSQYGPLMSDSIPLSSLAHARVSLDLRKVKAYFWARDFAGMGKAMDELHTVSDDRLLNAASYAADTISLWEKHSVKWTLETSVSQTFIHTIVSLFDCGLVVSEFLRRLEMKEQRSNEEQMLETRISKIFARVVEVVDGGSHERLCVTAVQVVSRILSKSYVWPFALVMGKALDERAKQLCV
ncbi:hypothetical protein TRVA0_021S02234 [Trichomonascus vanleenenianus]|uniref:FTFMHR domain-containing protein n=1 Tax=Trichomonascus vanleenenianus TaxID=2268995 RepID=UPI003EC9DC7A